MNNEPVAWARQDGVIAFHKKPEVDSQGFKWFPLYTHPSEHDLGIAEAIGFEKGHKSAEDKLRQQQAEIEALKDKLMLTKQSLEIVEGWTKK